MKLPQFNNPKILEQSLIHRSYLNENKEKKLESNERYEFLGDAILEFWISDYLFINYPKYPEGDLTNLRSLVVCTKNLAKIATKIGLDKKILLSCGEEKHGGRTNQSILADTLESFIGAIYLDSGYPTVKKFLEDALISNIKELSKQESLKDPKSIFQELAQSMYNITPHYKTIQETGPDHSKIFEVAVYVGEKQISTGKGNSKQKAEEDASIRATKKLNNQV
jgi:ribonuclease III